MSNADGKFDEFELEVDPDLKFGSDFDDFGLARELAPPPSTGAVPDQTGNDCNAATQVAVIRTSDRISYRRCRRMWSWSYSGRANLQSNAGYGPFWLGSGLHFALEDFHGYHQYTYPRDAFAAYARACESSGQPLPSDVVELEELATGMLDYYEQWLEWREPLNTLVIDGKPQVEVQVYIEIPKEHLVPYTFPWVLERYSHIYYSATLDRVIEDPYERLWTKEYKSAKRYEHMHLDTDPQVSAYSWVTSVKYPGREIAGTVYQQHKKQLLGPPQFLSSTKMFSTSKRQKTSVALYLGALRNLYGTDERRFPRENRAFLEYLKTQESDTRDELIRRDYVPRNPHQQANEYRKALMEIGEMLNPDLPIYPNPTRDCSWQCAFTTPCVAYDDGSDWEHMLTTTTSRRDAPHTHWRRFL